MISQTWIIECPKLFNISEQNRKLYLKSYGKLESATFNRRTNPGRKTSGRLTIATTICYSNDTMK